MPPIRNVRYAAPMGSGHRSRNARLMRRWSSLLAITPMACGSAHRQASPPCRISLAETHLDKVNVAAAERSFTVGLDGAESTIELTEGRPTARVLVTAPLRFTASFPVDKLAIRVAAETALYDGRIRLGVGAAPAWLGLQGDAMQVSLEPMLGVAVRQPLHVPCSRLGLGDGSPYATPQPASPPEERAIGTGTDFVPLYLEPREAAPLEIKYSGAFELRDRRDSWLLLEATWADGSRLRGWTRARHTTPQVVPVNGAGEGPSGAAICGRTDAPPFTRFMLREGAPISSSAGGVVWAHVSRPIAVDAFTPERADGWIRVAAVPGLFTDPCLEQEHIWVRASDAVRID